MVHPSSLCCKDLALRHFVVYSTSVRHARVINRKRVCVVLCCCVQCVEIYIKQRPFVGSINFFVFIWRKLLPNHTDYPEKLMVNMLHRKMISTFQKWWLIYKTRKITRNMENCQKIENVELQASLDEDDSQTQKQLVQQFGVSQEAVFNRLREMGKTRKSSRWVPY